MRRVEPSFSAHSDSGLVRPSGVSSGSTGGSTHGAQLAALVHMSVSIELPGAPGHTNADVVTHTKDSTKYVWNMDVGRAASDLTAQTVFVHGQGSVQLVTALTPLKSDAVSPVSASAKSSHGIGAGPLVGIGAGVVVLLAAGVILIRSCRNA